MSNTFDAPSAKTTGPQHASVCELSIGGLGLACSLGTDAVSACAAARAGISRPRVLPGRFVADPDTAEIEPTIGHTVGSLTLGFEGVARIARLGSLALMDLLKQGALDADEIEHTAVVLALTGGYHFDAAEFSEGDSPFSKQLPPPSAESLEFHDSARETAIARMFQLAGLPTPRRTDLVFDDHAGFAAALRRAAEWLNDSRVRRVVVGGIDSLCTAGSLESLEALGLLKTAQDPVGVAPGEAAAFVLVERAGPSGGGAARTVISFPAYVAGGAHQFDPDARGCRQLASVVAEAFARAGQGRCALSIGTHAGASWSADELGRTLASLPDWAAVTHHWFPASSFGETRAASTALATCVAARALERGYASGPTILVWASSPGGSKAAFTVTRG